MTKKMSGPSALAFHSRSLHRVNDGHSDSAVRFQRTKRRSAPNKHMVACARRPTLLKVSSDRIAHFLRQRQSRLTPPLPGNVNPGLLPIDIAQLKVLDISGAESHSCKQKKDRAIPSSHRCSLVAGLDDAFDFFLLQVLG